MLRRYNLKTIDSDRGNYIITLPFTSIAGLNRHIGEIIDDITFTADLRNGWAETDVYLEEGQELDIGKYFPFDESLDKAA